MKSPFESYVIHYHISDDERRRKHVNDVLKKKLFLTETRSENIRGGTKQEEEKDDFVLHYTGIIRGREVNNMFCLFKTVFYHSHINGKCIKVTREFI